MFYNIKKNLAGTEIIQTFAADNLKQSFCLGD
jgi:hypothetical protein